jgi:hypothetical protein
MPRPIKEYVIELLSVVERMHKDYTKKKFTLDGRLVGDIGEILAEQLYELTLIEGMPQLHDASAGNRMVQIKATMKSSLGFGEIPDFYLGIRIDSTGEVEEIFNGPGFTIWNAIKHQKRPKNNLYSVPINKLRKLNREVPPGDKLSKRAMAPELLKL